MPSPPIVFAAAILVTVGALFAARRRDRLRWPLTAVAAALLGIAGWLFFAHPPDPVSPTDTTPTVATSDSCAACHRAEYDSWHRSYHRTMTRDATPETVKGDFANAVHDYQGLRTTMTRAGASFYMETVSPDWAAARARLGPENPRLPPPQAVRLRVDRLVGSHWLQECLHRDDDGRYTRLPVLYHLGERRWVHTHGAFLAPDSDDFWALCRGANWNETCLYCHNTGPAKNPTRDRRGATVRYETTVHELGIACEACHGPGGEHVRARQAGRSPDPREDVVHPAALGGPRRDGICARCHGALVPIAAAWDAESHRDPFRPGGELTQFNHFFWSEAQQQALATGRPAGRTKPDPTDGRFWGDGTPLTTALEYNGMALSACYQQGHGKMSCLSCHTLHGGGDPTYQLKPGTQGNEACYQCHAGYRTTLAAHTRHGADSPGSLCSNCHMPHVVYSLMATHRSHRVQVPDLAGSLDTGKPHACNLCHLDKSLGWTRDELAKWPNGARREHRKLTADEETVSHALLSLTTGDARTRVVVAGAFERTAKMRAVNLDWSGPALTRLLQEERYPAVRLLAARGLRAAFPDRPLAFDPLAREPERVQQLRLLQQEFDARPLGGNRPGLPLTPAGSIDGAVIRRLLAKRFDPDLTINE